MVCFRSYVGYFETKIYFLEHDSKEEVQSAGELCTYTKTGDTFTEQHWYYCYTCKVVYQLFKALTEEN